MTEAMQEKFPDIERAEAKTVARTFMGAWKLLKAGDKSGLQAFAEKHSGKMSEIYKRMVERTRARHDAPRDKDIPDTTPQLPAPFEPVAEAKPTEPTGPVRSQEDILRDIGAEGETSLTPEEGKQHLGHLTDVIEREGLQTEITPDGKLRIFRPAIAEEPATEGAAPVASQSATPEETPTNTLPTEEGSPATPPKEATTDLSTQGEDTADGFSVRPTSRPAGDSQVNVVQVWKGDRKV
jgi:hypothetical protein